MTKQPPTKRALNFLGLVVLAILVLGLAVTALKAYWIWILIIAAIAIVIGFGGRTLIRVITTRTWHR